MKKTAIKAAALLLVLLIFTGCKGEPETLVDTESLYISVYGRETYVNDRAGNAEYYFTTERKRATRANEKPRICTDTATVNITLYGGIITVTDRTTGEIYAVERGRVNE